MSMNNAGSALLVFAVASFAGEAGAAEKSFDLSGYTAVECGQINRARYKMPDGSGEFQHTIMGHMYNNLSARITVNEHLSVLATFESRLWYNSVPFKVNYDPQAGYPKQNFDLYFPNAAGIVSFGQKHDPLLSITAGRFEFKYNRQAQNLGEYLFRTGTYPGYIITNFDLPVARIGGAKVSLTVSDWLQMDLLLTTMRDLRPFYDPSLSYLVSASAGRIIAGGAGVSLENFASAESGENSVLKDYSANGYLKENGDTAYYTFKGTKLLGWFSFDPKQFFNYTPIFGEEDFKLYGEAIVLGFQNYPASNEIDALNLSNPYGYKKLSERFPVMMGCNLPAFKLLDVLAAEFEYYSCRYQDSYYNLIAGQGYPLPSNIETPGYTDHDNSIDNWKWSFYAKKAVIGNLYIIGQAARDHLRTEIQMKQYADYRAALVRPNQWYWMMKLKFVF